MLTGTRDRDLVLVTSLREKLKAAAAAAAAATVAAAGAGYGASRKGARAEDVVKLFETISQVAAARRAGTLCGVGRGSQRRCLGG